VLEAVLWILNTGAQWHMLPQCYPNYKMVHRRFQQWCEREVLRAGGHPNSSTRGHPKLLHLIAHNGA